MADFSRIAGVFGAIGSNNGLEGITVDSDTGNIYLIKENRPRLLIQVSADLSTILGAAELSEARGFSCEGTDDISLDVSDITYDPERRQLWVLSDSGSCVFLIDPATGNAAPAPLSGAADGIARPVKNPEGIALNAAGTELRIVTDDGGNSRMLTYALE